MPALLLAAGDWCRAAQAAPGEPIFTRQNVFAIPFQVSPVRNAAEAPKMVQLYISDDQGANWRLDKQVEPGAARFPFRAPHEGEFWFQVRTVDASGKVVPEGQQPPGLKVVVDTVSPSIELSALEDKPGEVALQWRASDSMLDPGTMKIESQFVAGGPWYPIAPNEADVQRGPQNHSGQARFRVPDNAAEIAVRVELNDRAGNRATSQAKVRLASRAGTAAPGTSPTPSPAGQPALTRPGSVAPANPPAGQSASPSEPGGKPWPADQVVQRPLTSGAGNTPGGAPPLVPLLPLPPSPPIQPAGMSKTPDTLARSASEGTPSLARSASECAPRPPDGNSPVFGSQKSGPPPIPPLTPLPPLGSGSNMPSVPPIQNAPSTPPTATDTIPRSLFDPGMLPAGVNPQQVNVLKFQVDYSVESVGPSGVGRVELWGTRDGGRTWQSFGLDNDNKSPLMAVVPGNGLYGFRIVVTDANGRGEPAPRNGDAPQVWIAVDASPPDVRIHPPVPRGDTVPITFSVADEQLDPQSVALFYSHRTDGAWVPITQSLGNTTRYDWTPPPGLTGPVFFRLEARDRGGNVASAITREPMLLDRPLPKSTISGVRPQ